MKKSLNIVHPKNVTQCLYQTNKVKEHNNLITIQREKLKDAHERLESL